jgi:dihydrofolate synthase/folylpolyglutamate synthase
MKLPFWPNPQGYFNIDLGLSRVYELLARLENPHLKIPPTIHIAGTNGKGSTLAFLRRIFAESGLKIHTYTSPHLVNFNERIILADEEISDEFLNEILSECKIAAEKSPQIPVTFFEGITVAAFLAFSRVKADLLLLEVGMGGRLDATNVLPEVLCSVITPIAFDHEEFLGKTLAKIAFEKGGIIKKNCPVIISKQKASALKALENQATKMGCKMKIFGRDFITSFEKGGGQLRKQLDGGFRFKLHDLNPPFASFDKLRMTRDPFFKGVLTLPLPSLSGTHQIENAATAIAAALTQKKFPITENQIRSALTKTFHPARLQKINSGKFFKILPKNFELFLDGSHNVQGAETIKDFLKIQKNKRIYVIFSMLEDKNCEGFLKKIAGEIDYLIAMTIPDESKSRKASAIQKIAKKIGINSIAAENFYEAFERIFLQQKNNEENLILICGSLYLAGKFLKTNSIA